MRVKTKRVHGYVQDALPEQQIKNQPERDVHDKRPGRARLRVNHHAPSLRINHRRPERLFSLELKKPIVAHGHFETQEYSGASTSGGTQLAITGMQDGRIVLENVETALNGSEDVIMEKDRHGGFRTKTARGEWTLSPVDRRGGRELFFSPNDKQTPLVLYQLAVEPPATKTAAPRKEEHQAFAIVRGEISHHRASVTHLPGNKLMLRFNDTTGWWPAAFYFDTRTGRGEAPDGRKATITKPNADGERTVMIGKGGELATIVKLFPFDPVGAVGFFAEKTATLKIPSLEGEKTLTVRFGKQIPGSDRLPLTIDGVTFPSDLVIHPTGQGEFTIYLGDSRIWVRPQGPGVFDAIAEWKSGEYPWKGTFAL